MIKKRVPLGEIITLQRGYDLTAQERIPGAIPVYGAAGHNGFHDEAKVEGPGIVLGRSGGSFGQTHYVDQDFWPHNTAMFVSDFKGNNARYIYYLLKSIDFSNLNSGSAQPSLNRNFVYDFPISLASKFDQQKIAKVLSDLDAKIELNNRINAELEAMAKLIYEYWFVQFDFPNEDGKPYKSSGGKMVWNEELKRDVPEGWGCGTISNIATLTRGVTYNKDDIQEDGAVGTIPILRATNITENQIDLNNMVFVSEFLADEEQILRPYDILITMSSGSIDHIGKNGFYFFDKNAAFGAFCAKIQAIGDFRFYLYSYTQSDFFFTTIKNECLGTNINNLNGSIVKGLKLVIPDKFILDKFNQIVQPFFEKIRVNTKQNQQLSKLRDWLLPMLMNGQVSIEDGKGRAEEKLGLLNVE